MRFASPIVLAALLTFGSTSASCQGQTSTESQIRRLDPPEQGFFSKELDYGGIPIKAHAVVADAALFKAREWLERELRHLPDARANLEAAGAELHIIGKDQATSDLPEHRHLKGRPFDGKLTVDERTRGLGGVLASCGEENLLKLPGDRYFDRDICPHEFAHTLQQFGLSENVRKLIREQRLRSLAAGKWVKAYAGSNEDEYFAELTMWYFGGHGDMGMTGEKPTPGPLGLKRYDPQAYALLDSIYEGRIKVVRTEWQALAAQGKEAEATLRSGSSDTMTTIRFVNQTDAELKLFWLDAEGKRHSYGTLPPRSRTAQNTFVTHVWLVTDSQSNVLALFTAIPKPGLATIKQP